MGSSKPTSSEQKKKTKSSSKSSSKATTKTPVAKTPSNFKSSEFVGESDNENDEPTGTNSSSDSDNESMLSNPAVKSTSKPNSKPKGKAAESSDSSEAVSDAESESGSESDDEEEEEEEENETNVNGNKSVVPPSKKDAKTVSMKVAPFKAPLGFEKNSSKNSSKASQLFNNSNLEGKEIWYITAPASVPIASVKEMSLLDAKLGKAVFSQDGNDYGFVLDPLEDKTYTKMLLPSSSKDGYSIEKKPVDQIYHMQQVVNLSQQNDQATVPAKRPVRQQPKGLKARFQPVGFASAPGIIGSDDESDSEEVGRPPKFQKIVMSEDEASDVEMEDAPPASTPANKSKSGTTKKSRKESEEDADKSSKKKHKDAGDKKKKHKSSSTPTSSEIQELRILNEQTAIELVNRSIPLRLQARSLSDLDPEITTNTRASQASILPASKALKPSSNSDTTISQSHPTTSTVTTKISSLNSGSTKKKATGAVSTEGPGAATTKDEARREKKAQKEAKKRRLESRTDNF
ncbi:hypothetical protein SBOR_2791 [Sclerotinia borealis F-4128]|uniref:DNA-directed RNA polymerase I subunit RPA34.5 n=1 Tax=Sclerotinia borealis (strain F-4128) TaxID=1432307 RepID=W9CQN6_SCLBF|nr:hypothetical protein SBOR_2791 [Sclerotinia borealis F-4128]